MQFILRLFPEISIKSPPVRKRWSKKLAGNLRVQVRRLYERSAVVLDWDRIIVRVHSDDEDLEARVVQMLESTPGIANFSRVSEYPYESIHDIYELAFKHWGARLKDKTFCVRVKRNGQHDFNSLDVERYVGGGLNQHSEARGVKLKGSDVVVHIEIKDETCYIVEERRAGLGGFPLGTQEDVLSLVSGGFDSTVASYLFMRRGVKTHFCFFNLGGDEHELAVKEVAFYLWNRFGSSHRVKFISVPFEPVVNEIMRCIDPANMGVVLKRMMLRAADKLSERGKWNALVTGEAISQVSSQTLPNLKAIESVCNQLVLRPLVVMHKPEIIQLARDIGTEAFSANIPEYCGVISVKPSSQVNVRKLEAEEAEFDFSVLDQAIADTKVQLIDEVMPTHPEKKADEPPSVTELSPEITVIDIRHPAELERHKLLLSEGEALEIPFYALNERVSDLDKGKHYALYCDKGVMSRLHAAHLRDQGWQNISVFRPETT